MGERGQPREDHCFQFSPFSVRHFIEILCPTECENPLEVGQTCFRDYSPHDICTKCEATYVNRFAYFLRNGVLNPLCPIRMYLFTILFLCSLQNEREK